jgi:hypothetical protein
VGAVVAATLGAFCGGVVSAAGAIGGDVVDPPATGGADERWHAIDHGEGSIGNLGAVHAGLPPIPIALSRALLRRGLDLDVTTNKGWRVGELASWRVGKMVPHPFRQQFPQWFEEQFREQFRQQFTASYPQWFEEQFREQFR